ncbi:FixH family protein [Halobacillus sp. KGW1]|uniref:FixH family protein n=1 Tax=Halobacillus sp. KGW1 TaxID=1793726 RepID=UPI000780A926|nr:FixH family protein [Halobacillus sp. KGW1]
MERHPWSSAVIIFLLLTAVTACSTNEEQEGPLRPEVVIQVDHEPLPVGEQSVLQAEVTREGQPVKNAASVKFEVWFSEKGQDTSEILEAKHVGNGRYEASYTFKENGAYEVITHTQVDDIHTMPKRIIAAGDELPKDAHDSDRSAQMAESMFMVQLVTEEDVKQGEPSLLTVHINHMEEPFSDAEVRLEITAPFMKEPAYVDTDPVESGEYRGQFTFPQTGSYKVNVHFEKMDEDIHGHKEETLDIEE